MAEVEKVHENRIVIENRIFGDFLQKGPISQALNRIQALSVVSGKHQYWIYRLMAEIERLFKQFDGMRMGFVRNCAEKDEKGELIMVPGTYIMDETKVENLQKELIELNIRELSGEEKQKRYDEIMAAHAKKDKNGNPQRSNPTEVRLSAENQIKFNEMYELLLAEKTVLSFDKIIIQADVLEKMNNFAIVKGQEELTIQNMNALLPFVEFTE